MRPSASQNVNCMLAVPRYGPQALFVQQSDVSHFNGKGLAGKQACRERSVPPEHLIPVYEAAVRHIVQAVQASFEVKTAHIKHVLSM